MSAYKPTKVAMKTQSQTYCVTGAAGFIGSHLCHAIFAKYPNATIIGIDDINTYYNTKIKMRRISNLMKNDRFIFYKTSILNKIKIRQILNQHKPSILIHAAAQVGVKNGETNPFLYYSTNVLGTSIMLEETSSYISHVLILSSSSVYGSTKKIPFTEDNPVTITTPISVYGASKAAMEMVAYSFWKKTGIPTTIVRPFSVYGPDGRPDMLPIKLLVAAIKNKPINIYAPTKSFRDWTYIDDCIKNILFLCKHPKGFQILNVGGGNPTRLDNIISQSQKVIHQFGYSIKYVVKPANPFEMVGTFANTKKLQSRLNQSFVTEYDKGFKKTADFFFSHSNLYL